MLAGETQCPGGTIGRSNARSRDSSRGSFFNTDSEEEIVVTNTTESGQFGFFVYQPKYIVPQGRGPRKYHRHSRESGNPGYRLADGSPLARG